MNSKRRKRVIVAAGLVLAAGGTLAYILLRENPNYVRAAETLPQAKAAATEAFGTLTWEDYRAERGIETRDDADAWEAFGKTRPHLPLSVRRSPEPGDDTLRKYFLANRQWYMEVYGQIKELTVQHVYDPAAGDWSNPQSYEVASLRLLLAQGVIGAADAGDIEAVRKISQAEWSLREKELSEIDWSSYLPTQAKILAFESALLVAAVRNRQNPELLDEIRDSVRNWPRMPSVADTFAGDIRSESLMLDELRGLGPGEIDQWLDDLLVRNQELITPLRLRRASIELERDFYNAVQRFRSSFRGTGPHTSAALEARFWETAVEFHDALTGFEGDRSGSRKRVFVVGDSLIGHKDVSYELALLVFIFNFVSEVHVLSVGRPLRGATDAQRTAVEMVWRFPQFDMLPEELPQDLMFADPRGGGDVLYRKTDAGFVIYSRGEDGVDDGFVPNRPNQFREMDVMSVSTDKDEGLVVCYHPIVPVP
ncbi:MAG: hypothetical protein IH945_03785 [Armatimonadetes bacterium]|nr:hypothetical protein [Armatimonadota bacterium]